MKKRLFTYAVLLHTTDDKGKVTDSEIIVAPTNILAKDEAAVVFKVTRLIPEDHAENPDNVEILIKAF